jgi:hypothetical protein
MALPAFIWGVFSPFIAAAVCEIFTLVRLKYAGEVALVVAPFGAIFFSFYVLITMPDEAPRRHHTYAGIGFLASIGWIAVVLILGYFLTPGIH